MSTYSLLSAARIFGGPDSIEHIKDVVADFGATRALIISDQGVARAGLIARPQALLEAAGVAVTVLDNTPQSPTSIRSRRFWAPPGRTPTTSSSASAAAARWTSPRSSPC
jgi:alcohol dehydrogenase class IV